MPFNTQEYLKEKAIQFVNEFTGDNPIGLTGFKTKLKYYLSTLNNDLDKRTFVNNSLDLLHSFPKSDQERLKDFILRATWIHKLI